MEKNWGQKFRDTLPLNSMALTPPHQWMFIAISMFSIFFFFHFLAFFIDRSWPLTNTGEIFTGFQFFAVWTWAYFLLNWFFKLEHFSMNKLFSDGPALIYAVPCGLRKYHTGFNIRQWTLLLLSPLEHFFLSQISIREILHSTKKFPVHCKNIMSEIK